MDRSTLERKRIKVENFLADNSVKIPILSGCTLESDDVNLIKNKRLQKVIKQTILKEVVRTLREDIGKDEFFKMDRYQWIKPLLNFNTRNKQLSAQFKSDVSDAIKVLLEEHKDDMIISYNANVLSKIMKDTIPSAQHIVLSSMIVDSMSDCDYNWLDFYQSLTSTAVVFCEDETINIKEDQRELIMAACSDYVDYSSAMLSMFVFKLFRQLDSESKEQLIGNIGSMYEMRDSIEYVLVMELLSKGINTRWLLEYVIQNKVTPSMADNFSLYFIDKE